MNIDAYLNRLLFSREVKPTLGTLKKLHYHHLLTVPIENLDIHAGRKIILEPAALFNKLISQKRGGICYELNGLFYELLRAIGFQVKQISGRVFDPSTGFNEEFDHLALIVHLDGIDWLVDVSFGRRFPLYPMPLVWQQVQRDRSGWYRIVEHDADYLAVQHQTDSHEWVTGYIFTLEPRVLTEFNAMCQYHETSPDSYYVRNKLCSIATAHGRITLTEHSLKITEHERFWASVVADEHHFDELLMEYFGMKGPAKCLTNG